MRPVRILLDRVGPESVRGGPAIFRRTRVLLVVAVVVANAVGAGVVFVFSAWVAPHPTVSASTKHVILANFALLAVFLPLALLVGTLWGTRRLRGARAWLEEERDPDEEERVVIVRAPARITMVVAVLWLVGAVAFGGLNATFSGKLALVVAVTVLLGGVTTMAVAYLLAERILRTVTARALAVAAPDRPLVPGVTARSLLAWALGTGVPIVGLMLVAVLALTKGNVGRTQLAVTVLGLGGVAMAVGLLVAVLAARATADPLLAVRRALHRVERGDLDVEVPVYDGSEVGLLQAGFNRMVAELRERERIREIFGTYVDHEVAEHILSEGVSLEGEEAEVTLMFLDVRDFTGLSEQAPARDVVRRLNRLFETVVPIVRRHRGHVDKFVGDGLLAVFGAPQRLRSPADAALSAALAIAAAVEAEDAIDLEVGIGLSSGRVIAGNVGGAGRLEFSVIGDAVNVAARVEEATRDTGDVILISEETAKRLQGDVELERRPGVELRGKSEPVGVLAPVREPQPEPADSSA